MPILFHRTFGEQTERAVVLLHGMLGSSRNWLTTAGELATGGRVYAPDLRNHGQSFHSDTMAYAELANDVVEWMDALGLGEAVVVGHSMGGKTAMVLAEHFPQRVRALGVIDIAPRDYHSQAHRAEFAAMNELDLRTVQSRADAEMRFEARVPDWAMRKFLTTNLERTEDGGWRWVINLPVLTRSLPELEGDPLAAGAGYGGPVRFWRGGRSTYIRDEDELRIARLYPQSSLVRLETAGHNPHMDSRAELVASLRGFVDDAYGVG
ncbi:alpha/beta fold hydrolase [Nibricoccus sp. IMCC34717]|uniref:alpha/beta fold hydrolase n=1 Tax=Nibricoccus sp. IMCC34717 TaxID=3034021 RepID=UPI00384A6FA9